MSRIDARFNMCRNINVVGVIVDAFVFVQRLNGGHLILAAVVVEDAHR